jgi:pimeloyl-ACP methyl ester carboxylesterase
MRAGFADYRASFPDDADDADFGRRLAMPVHHLWGEHSFLQTLNPIKVWADYAENVTGAVIEDCGHFLAEERPQEVLAALKSFLIPS